MLRHVLNGVDFRLVSFQANGERERNDKDGRKKEKREKKRKKEQENHAEMGVKEEKAAVFCFFGSS